MSKLIIRDKDGNVIQTVDSKKPESTTKEADKHLDELCGFFGI